MKHVQRGVACLSGLLLGAFSAHAYARNLTGTWADTGLYSVSALSVVEDGGRIQATLHYSRFSDDGPIHESDQGYTGVVHDGQFQIHTPAVLGMSSSFSGSLQGKDMLLMRGGHLWSLHRVSMREYMDLLQDLRAVHRYALAAYALSQEDSRMQDFVWWAKARREAAPHIQSYYLAREKGYQRCLDVTRRVAMRMGPGRYIIRPYCTYDISVDNGPQQTSQAVHHRQSQLRSKIADIKADELPVAGAFMHAVPAAWAAAQALDPHEHNRLSKSLHTLALRYAPHPTVLPQDFYPHYTAFMEARPIGEAAISKELSYVKHGTAALKRLKAKIHALDVRFDKQ